jgi:hypothetical protein
VCGQIEQHTAAGEGSRLLDATTGGSAVRGEPLGVVAVVDLVLGEDVAQRIHVGDRV